MEEMPEPSASSSATVLQVPGGSSSWQPGVQDESEEELCKQSNATPSVKSQSKWSAEEMRGLPPGSGGALSSMMGGAVTAALAAREAGDAEAIGWR